MKTALVTGGGGFLGGAVVRKLLETGGWRVRSFSRGEYPELVSAGVECFKGDLAEGGRELEVACRGVDVVFHVAARAGMWGAYEEYHRANVVGTANLLAACRSCGVPCMVYTGSPSVVFSGKDIEGADETLPYPSEYDCHYSRTKAEAERMVIAACSEDFAACSLRPHLIWGPGDRHLLPRLLERARSGRLRIIGDGSNVVDTVYVDNAADAHLAAADALLAGRASGRAYFITNDDPRPLWEIVNSILRAAGLPPVRKKVPGSLAVAAGWFFETVYGVLGLAAEPPMTRWVAKEMMTSHWFDISAAKRDLGYSPSVSIDEGMKRLARWLADCGG